MVQTDSGVPSRDAKSCVSAPVDNQCDGQAGDTTETPMPEVMVRRHASAVWGVCLAHTRNIHDSEDIMQDVFIKAFTKLHTLKDPGRLRGWLLQIARRACIDFLRGRVSERQAVRNMPAERHVMDKRVLRIHKAISQLPDNYREPIILYYLDGRDCRGVAQALGISETAVRSRLTRARLQLHKILREDES
jgi:RNA polymerase sigma-70 factor (ECF subfamily)